MKGLLRGLRYISQIFGMEVLSLMVLVHQTNSWQNKQSYMMCSFLGVIDRNFNCVADNDEKEPEMQIGYPTDVKHVAHIGWDGPSVIHQAGYMLFSQLILDCG